MDNTKKPYRVLTSEYTGEYEEKKSRFLSRIRPVNSEEEALSFIAEVKKEHYDARHNCTAMIIGPGREFVKCSDDGEPQGTAGKPMLEVLNGADITNVCAVVTRYFGGTLLGTGGLVRAYTEAVKDALKDITVATVLYCQDAELIVGYEEINNIQYFIEKNDEVMLLDTRYEENVCYLIRVPHSSSGKIFEDLTSLTRGKIKIAPVKEGYEALDGKSS